MSSPESAYHPSSAHANNERRSSHGSVEDNQQTAQAKSPIRKLYTCKTCHKSFTTSGHLSRHQRTHTGERAYGCPWPGCSTRCSRQDNLQQHYRTHLSPRSRKADLSSAKAMRAGIKSVMDVPKELLSKGGRTRGSSSQRRVSAKADYKREESILNQDADTHSMPSIPFKPGYLPSPQLPIPSTSAHSLPATTNRRASLGTQIQPVHLNSRSSPSFSMSDSYSTLNPVSHLISPSPETISPATSPMQQSRSSLMHSYQMEPKDSLSSYHVSLDPKVNSDPQSATPLPIVPPMYRSADMTASSTTEYNPTPSSRSQDSYLNHSTTLPSLSIDLNSDAASAHSAYTPNRMFTIPTNIAQSSMFRPLAGSFEYTEYPTEIPTQVAHENEANEFYHMSTPEDPSSLDFSQQWNTQYY
ncbi:Transcriptional regulator NRG1 [Wallemia ichthyophaga EXF-994]|uniref:Transcriptional regulator NRG1 n=1 Tax=Wallemia ichthyophaga (strain EXF-994 / CBS 113033) TaxID=1299270 RepID=R9ADU4_WALI9|nr:Transcriptional regulator NRG1 [Wallemia ichthyophaga EXF-994]EOR00374.1 Transcriptional regulator NRG1 [Wallemia ichthyophaga EXF-994]